MFACTATNAYYETRTNGSGEYHVANLDAGVYRLEVEKDGFKRLIKADLILHVQDALSLDFELPIGSTSESINVEAAVLAVDTASATVSTVVDRAFVEEIPLNGRSFQTLIMLTPGVVVSISARNVVDIASRKKTTRRKCRSAPRNCCVAPNMPEPPSASSAS